MAFFIFGLLFLSFSVQPLFEHQRRKPEGQHPEHRQKQQLGPPGRRAGPFKKDAAHDLQKIPKRHQVGEILHGLGHGADGKHEPGKQHVGGHEELVYHHGLGLGVGDGGDQHPDPQHGEDEDYGGPEQVEQAALEDHPEPQGAQKHHQHHVYQRHQGKGQGLAGDQLPGGDGADYDLLHGALFLLPHDAQSGQHRGHLKQHHADQPRDHVVDALQLGVEPDPGPGVYGHLQAAGGTGPGELLPDQADGLVGQDLLQIALGDAGLAGVAAVDHDLDVPGPPGGDVGGQPRRKDHRRLDPALVQVSVNFLKVRDLGRLGKIPGVGQPGRQLPGIGALVQVADQQLDVLDVGGGDVAEQQGLDDGYHQDHPQGHGIAEDLDELLADQKF